MTRPDERVGDDPMARLAEAKSDLHAALRWCRDNRVTLTTSTQLHLWTLTRGSRRAEWWPMRSRLVLDGRGRRARIAPRWAEVQFVLNALWNAPRQEPTESAEANA